MPRIKDARLRANYYDMAAQGISSLPLDKPFNPPPQPNGNALGTSNAFMSVDPQVVSTTTTSAVAVLASGFTPYEHVAFSINGAAATIYNADSGGFLGVFVSTGATQGYNYVTAYGQISGKQAGGNFLVLNNARQTAGVAVAPHAVGASQTIEMMGTGNVTQTLITLSRGTTDLATAATDAYGGFYTSLISPSSVGTANVYGSYFDGTPGSRSGQSVEQRSDAGSGDNNTARAFVDRAVHSSSTVYLNTVAEGFQAGETVTISGCSSGTSTADSNGAAVFLSYSNTAGQFACIYTGNTSGRVAYTADLGASDAANIPSVIAKPSSGATSSFSIRFTKFNPSTNGTVYLDGTSIGTASTTSSGTGSANVSLPTSSLFVLPTIMSPAMGRPTVWRPTLIPRT